MKQRSKSLVLKGFTLLEMMIVVVIIGTLTAIVVPISRGYYINSRIRTENSNARVIYNSLQTICQEFEFAERGSKNSVFYGNGIKSGNLIIFVENGKMTKAIVNGTHVSTPTTGTDTATIRSILYSDGTTNNVRLVTALDDVKINVGSTEPDPSNFLQRVNRIYSGSRDASYVAYIEDYSVKAVFAADDMESYYVGQFPTRASGIQSKTLSEVEVDELETYVTNAWAS